MNNLFEQIPEQLPKELTSVLLQSSQLRIERIVSKGQASAADSWYQQTEHEWVLLLQGDAILEFEQPLRQQPLLSGDFILIPAGVRHRVQYTSSNPVAIWLCIFYPDG